MADVSIYYTHGAESMSDARFEDLLCTLPKTSQKEVMAYIAPQDRCRTLMGRLLARDAISALSGISGSEVLSMVRRDEAGRPTIGNGIDFNISHSGDYVMCAASTDTRIGVNIEQIRDLDLARMVSSLSKKERGLLGQARITLHDWFIFWTIKESVLKADGLGLAYPLELIETAIDNKIIELKGNIWYTYRLFPHREYIAHLSTAKMVNKINFIFKDYCCRLQ